MVAPWIGVPLNDVAEATSLAQSKAKFSGSIPCSTPQQMHDTARGPCQLAYREGLRIDEAWHRWPSVGGALGRVLPNENGAAG